MSSFKLMIEAWKSSSGGNPFLPAILAGIHGQPLTGGGGGYDGQLV
jgi:hypothetical protein